ncbi:aldo/keto reductase [Paenibacillus sp. HN-1]|uniref:aldo/keto reductase n=1 Tax=Paenibacillus TaxID=44249 RepID=UPI001CA82963|nr:MULTISPECIES: aldo/keto reductase [Paenibacillus]MBY9082515.1 aldo/keto reductase [Paenibacillus sp. CGMCC 1.18879]MBY9084874.1 aldo/keto reductase [Paenibacillus sinensis]
MKGLTDTILLNNGVAMPRFGLGTYKASGDEVERAVEASLEIGYRSIDTASLYGNEAQVGRAIRGSGIRRNELFITTKVWNDDQGYDKALAAFERSRELLGLEMVDLYLIHWPGVTKYKDTWRALERLLEEGSVRAIGVSNFQIHHLEALMQVSGTVPAVNQVELHPRLRQRPLHDFCLLNNIQIEAWSPLMRGNLEELTELQPIAAKYGKSPAQVILRWQLQSDIITIPKSVTPSRIKENSEIFDFELLPEELEILDSMDKGIRTGTHPDDLLF